MDVGERKKEKDNKENNDYKMTVMTGNWFDGNKRHKKNIYML